jgi:acetyl esterase/lipase
MPDFSQPFRSLSDERRRELLELGPRWTANLSANRAVVLAAYSPVLAARPREDIRVTRDLAYGPHPRHRLDIYNRPGTRDAPVVVFVHGGAFVRGEKDSTPEIYGNFTRYFARHGCVGVNIEYRLAPQAIYPAGAEDVAAAIAWVRDNIHQYGGNTGRIILAGHSAGASHAGAYACDPVVHQSRGHGLAGLALLSGRLRADVHADNPNAQAVRDYYGANEALHDVRSVVTHASNINVPLFIAVAEYENPYLDLYSAEMAYRAGIRNRRLPVFIQLPGHNHTSLVAHFDAGEELLDRALLEFVRSLA